MKNMFHEAPFSDVTVIVRSSSAGECSVSLDLHRNVLANHSDFFRGMFTRSFRESAEETVTIEVAEGSSVAATVLVLEYMYTSTARIDSNNIIEVLASADKLQLPDLRDYCEAYLAQNLCRHSVCSTWKVSHLLDLTQLGTKCKDLVLSQGGAILEEGDFSDLPKELALAVVSDEDLNASEEVIFEAVVAWGETNKGTARLRDAIADFIPLLRFVEMGHAFIQNQVRQSGLVPESMLLDAVMEMMDKTLPTIAPGYKRAFSAADCESDETAAARPAKRLRRG
jgi:hypothetical protein